MTKPREGCLQGVRECVTFLVALSSAKRAAQWLRRRHEIASTRAGRQEEGNRRRGTRSRASAACCPTTGAATPRRHSILHPRSLLLREQDVGHKTYLTRYHAPPSHHSFQAPEKTLGTHLAVRFPRRDSRAITRANGSAIDFALARSVSRVVSKISRAIPSSQVSQLRIDMDAPAVCP